MDVPRHSTALERAAELPLVTESATVTLHEAMDRGRNDEVLPALRALLAGVGDESWLADVKSGADYDWDALDRRLADGGASDATRETVRTLGDRIDRPYPSLLRLRVDPETDLDFAPGQYVALRAEDTPRAYSIASPPSENELEFAIRRVPGGRLTSELFTDVDVGDPVVVRGPNGDMVLRNPSPGDIVFLATGTGVAPFKSMIDHLFEQGYDEHGGRRRQVWLFLGCGWADDLPYRKTFRALDRERANFHFVPTLTREPLLTDWDGETEYVQQVFVKYLVDGALSGVELPNTLEPFRGESPVPALDTRIDPADTNVYACGVTAMVQTLVRAARAVGVPDDRMEYEGFG